jgi:flagellar motor switch protein FliM
MDRVLRALRRALGTIARAPATVSAEPPAVIAIDDYLAASPQPFSAALIRAEPTRGHLLATVPQPLASALVDGLFGGRAAVAPRTVAELTPAEERVTLRVAETVAAALARAWPPATTVSFASAGLETSAQGAAAIDPEGAATLYPFAIELNGSTSRLDVIWPHSLLRTLVPLLQPRADAVGAGSSAWATRLAGSAARAPLVLHASIGDAQISVRALLGLTPGMLIPFRARPAAALAAGGLMIAEGELGASGGAAAVRITRLVGRTTQLGETRE